MLRFSQHKALTLDLENLKMEHIEFVTEILQQNDWVGRIDLADAYFCIPYTEIIFFCNGELFCYKISFLD